MAAPWHVPLQVPETFRARPLIRPRHAPWRIPYCAPSTSCGASVSLCPVSCRSFSKLSPARFHFD
eukprot:8693249-Pyramimonas_sp.AAC.1